MASPERVPEWTAAIFNRGTPGFAVDSGGALHVSLLRACTGWPSGVWIDPPRRSTPDGSAFELEHWSHTFDYALFLGRGDWRQAGCAEAAHTYNRTLRASAVPPHTGALPARASLLRVEPLDDHASAVVDGGRPPRPGAVLLAALKPAGTPLASGDAGLVETAVPDEVEITLRAYECAGGPIRARVTSSLGLLRRAQPTNLLEQSRGEPLVLDHASPGEASASIALGAGEIVTLRLGFSAGEQAVAGAVPGPPDLEPALPVFSRYWLHNKGPAPIGNQSVAAHVLPTALVARAGDFLEVIAQVASSRRRVSPRPGPSR